MLHGNLDEYAYDVIITYSTETCNTKQVASKTQLVGRKERNMLLMQIENNWEGIARPGLQYIV